MQSGMALLLGAMLVAAGLPKAIAPWYVASALRRVLRRGSDRRLRLAGRLLGCWELALGAALLLVGGPAAVPVAALAVATFAGFVGFVALAVRRGAACGCWASLSEGPAGGAELGRAVFLAAVAADLLDARVDTLGPPAATHADWRSLAWAAGLLAGAYLAARLGAVLLPVPSARLRRQLGAQAPAGVLGRTGAQLAMLAGFVHAGTRAGRRRFLAATLATAAPAVAGVPHASALPAPTRPAAPPTRPVDGPVTVVHRSRMALPPRPPAAPVAAPDATALAAAEGSST